MEPTKPGDQFIFEDIPRTAKRVIAKTAETRVRLITKSAVQHYIDRYLNSKGDFHKQLEFTAPFAVSYDTSLSGNPDEDPTIYNVQLARIWSGLRERLPAIIIADTGFDWHNSGLGGLDPGILITQKTFAMQSAMLASVTLDILVVSLDEQTTSDLADILAYIFGPLTAMNKAWVLSSSNAEDNWEVRLPITGPSPTGMDRRNITDDPKDSVWTNTISIVPDFEGITRLEFDSDINPEQRRQVHPMMRNTEVAFDASGYPKNINQLRKLFTRYTVPKQIRLGRPHALIIETIPSESMLFSDNAKIAVVDEKGVIFPKRMGKFNLVCVQSGASSDTEKASAILRSDEISVVAS